ncbi:MAG TPA: FtsW/RodA/SpoVE family cell cycle protein [bacterium]|nr:FtsW/RodA/SpoVE family cell cycle protein [bacterium]
MTHRNDSRWFRARPRELNLLLLTLPALLAAILAAAIDRLSAASPDPRDLLIPAGFLASAGLAHILLVTAGSRADATILPLWTMIGGIGIVFQWRLGSITVTDWKTPQLMILLLSPLWLAVNALLFNGHMKRIASRIPWLWILLAFAACVGVMAMGQSYRGGVYGPGKTTPTEIVKPLLILGLSGLLIRHGSDLVSPKNSPKGTSRRAHIIIIGAWLLPAVILVMLHDLGMLAATGLLLIVLISVATARKRYLITGALLAGAGGWFFKEFVTKGRVRFAAWLHPFDFPDTSGFQTIRSLFALFNGEFFGRGIGNGFPGTIPLAETDFTYAVIAEEMGWIGSVAILLLAWRICRLGAFHGRGSTDAFSALIAIGCSTVWGAQILLHAGGVIKLIPMTGVPLPGISSGGTSVIVFSMLAGWIMAVSEAGSENQRS